MRVAEPPVEARESKRLRLAKVRPVIAETVHRHRRPMRERTATLKRRTTAADAVAGPPEATAARQRRMKLRPKRMRRRSSQYGRDIR